MTLFSLNWRFCCTQLDKVLYFYISQSVFHLIPTPLALPLFQSFEAIIQIHNLYSIHMYSSQVEDFPYSCNCFLIYGHRVAKMILHPALRLLIWNVTLLSIVNMHPVVPSLCVCE